MPKRKAAALDARDESTKDATTAREHHEKRVAGSSSAATRQTDVRAYFRTTKARLPAPGSSTDDKRSSVSLDKSRKVTRPEHVSTTVSTLRASATTPRPPPPLPYDAAIKLLRSFDLNQDFGPCVGISRLQRFHRAMRLGKSVDDRVLACIESYAGVQANGKPMRAGEENVEVTRCLWHEELEFKPRATMGI